MLRNYWYVACELALLGPRPVTRTVFGESIVVFRADAGRVVAVAALGAPGQRDVATIVQDGYVWVWVGDAAPDPVAPPLLATAGTAPWAVTRLEAVTHNAVAHVIENFIDTSHTGYLHGGLFRQPAANVVRTVVKTCPDGVSIDLEERAADGVLGRLLVRPGERIGHQDRFILPAIVRVAYDFGARAGVVAHHVFTPEDAWRTRIYVHFAPRLGPFTAWARLLAPLIGGTILRQDVAILDRQGRALRETPAAFCSVGADTANGWIAACRRRAADGSGVGPAREKVVHYKL